MGSNGQWRRAKLNELGKWGSGGTPSRRKPEYFGGDISWLKISDLNDGLVTSAEEAITQEGLDSSTAKLLPTGALLVAMYGSIGKLGITGIPCATNQAIAHCLPDETEVDLRFLYWALRSARGDLIHIGKGGNQQNISQTVLKDFEILLPDLDTQREVAKFADRLESQVAAIKPRLARSRTLLSSLPPTLLDAAFSGELTRAWRSARALDESGDELVADLQRRHSETPKSFGGKASQPTGDVHDLTADALPDGWALTELQVVCHPGSPITYGILKPGADTPGGVPYVRVADFPEDRVKVEGVKRTATEIASQYRRSQLRTDDLLLSIRGTVGRVARVPAELDGANITQDTARIRVDDSINLAYIEWYLRSASARRRLKAAMKGVAVRGVNLGDVRVLQTPIPPVDEQHEIVRIISSRLDDANRTMARIDRAAANVLRALDTGVSRAFSAGGDR